MNVRGVVAGWIAASGACVIAAFVVDDPGLLAVSIIGAGFCAVMSLMIHYGHAGVAANEQARDGTRPTLPQVAFGIVSFLAMAGLALYWAADETSTGNRIFLWCVAGLALVLALWRLVIGIRLAREGSARHR